MPPPPAPPPEQPVAPVERIVFLGDSITDGDTYPLLLRQVLADAGRPVAVCINAGVAGDTAQGMRRRLERDVFPHRPTLVTLSAGINDVLHNVPLADYEKDVAAIAEQLQARKVPLLILTTTVLGPKHAAADRKLAEYNAVLRKVAAAHGCKVAEVNQRMQSARASGRELLEPDQVHLNLQGYRVMVRALLDALGETQLPVPWEMKVEPMPGLLPECRIRAVRDGEPPLDEHAVRDLQPDTSWKPYPLPEKEPLPSWWPDQERKRGFAMSLERLIGPAKAYRGIASLEAAQPRDVFFNTGAQLQSVWLNGRRDYQSEGWTGWHAGKERVPARLRAGRNVIVFETGGPFFLSVTDDNTW